MSFIKSLFSTDKFQSTSAPTAAEAVTVDLLKELIPIRTIEIEILTAFAESNTFEKIAAQSILFKQGEPANSALYLIHGTLELSDASKNVYTIESGSPKARFPISSGATYTVNALAKTEVTVLRVARSIMAGHKHIEEKKLDFDLPPELMENRLLKLFLEYFRNEKLEVPAFPAIAVQIRKAMQKELAMPEIAKIIQLDPVISGKLVELANCPLYVSAEPAKSCLAAIQRIGLNATRSLVTALSIQSVYKSQSKKIQHSLGQAWRHSLYLSMLCHVLATSSKQSNPEEALLAGLVADIGVVPFLHFAANLPEEIFEMQELEQALPFVKKQIGYIVLKTWEFPTEFLQVALYSDDWFHSESEHLHLKDMVLLSKLHSKLGSAEKNNCPPINSIPAASKLKKLELSPEQSLKILHEAKQQINLALKTLSN